MPVILTAGDVDINQEMLNLKFGEKRFMTQNTTRGQQQQHGGGGSGKGNSPNRPQRQTSADRKAPVSVQVNEQGQRRSFIGEDKPQEATGSTDSYFR